MQSLRNQIVLITGAGGGFGLALVRQFVRAGSQLILTDRHTTTPPTLVALLQYDQRAQRQVLGYISADLTDTAGCTRLYEQCSALTPHLDILVNNAGLAMRESFARTPQEQWECLMQVNLLAPMRLIAAFLPAMIARGHGHIVNIASVAAILSAPGLAAYNAAKFGLHGFSDALAYELRAAGVGVTTIYPFFMRTPMLDGEAGGDRSTPRLPNWLVYDPEDVAVALLRGLVRGKQHIYPGGIAQGLVTLQRIAPWIWSWACRLTVRLEAQRRLVQPAESRVPNTTPHTELGTVAQQSTPAHESQQDRG